MQAGSRPGAAFSGGGSLWRCSGCCRRSRAWSLWVWWPKAEKEGGCISEALWKVMEGTGIMGGTPRHSDRMPAFQYPAVLCGLCLSYLLSQPSSQCDNCSPVLPCVIPLWLLIIFCACWLLRCTCWLLRCTLWLLRCACWLLRCACWLLRSIHNVGFFPEWRNDSTVS